MILVIEQFTNFDVGAKHESGTSFTELCLQNIAQCCYIEDDADRFAPIFFFINLKVNYIIGSVICSLKEVIISLEGEDFSFYTEINICRHGHLIHASYPIGEILSHLVDSDIQQYVARQYTHDETSWHVSMTVSSSHSRSSSWSSSLSSEPK